MSSLFRRLTSPPWATTSQCRRSGRWPTSPPLPAKTPGCGRRFRELAAAAAAAAPIRVHHRRGGRRRRRAREGARSRRVDLFRLWGWEDADDEPVSGSRLQTAGGRAQIDRANRRVSNLPCNCGCAQLYHRQVIQQGDRRRANCSTSESGTQAVQFQHVQSRH